MHMVTCKVSLGGDLGNVVWRNVHNPVSWPEVGVLQALHGEESVFDMEVCGEVDATRAGEKARLAEIYGKEAIEQIYPGRAPVLEMDMPGVSGVPERRPQPGVRTVPEQPATQRFNAPAPVKRDRKPIPADIPDVEV